MLSFIIETARAAGEEAMKHFGKLRADQVSTKGSVRDLVSEADKAVEDLIISRIRARYPEHSIFGEETGKSGDSPDCWVIDPIDGTQNFVKNIPAFSVSIGFKRNNEPYAGCVYQPALNMIFYAEKGKGAFENGKPIHVSNCRTLEEAACATGFARLRENKVEPVLEKFDRILPQLRDIKRCGSAALDLAMTAAGVYDGYWEEGLQLYDVAAGAIIAREAGAVVCDFNGKNNFPADGIMAATPEIAAQMLDYLQ